MNPTKVLFILSLVNATKHFATAAPPRNDWSKMDLATLEEDWREGDEAEELATPDDELYDLLDRKRKHASDRMEYLAEHKIMIMTRHWNKQHWMHSMLAKR